MHQLPHADPGRADHRSPARLIWWMAREQWQTLLGGMAFGVIWMCSSAVLPAVIGKAIDAGVRGRDGSALVRWALVLFAIGLVGAVAGVMRHRFAVTNWLSAAYRTVQLVARHATHLGATLSRRVATGEVVSIGTNDLVHMGNAMDVSARAAGALVSFVVVAVILLQTSVVLGLVVLLGVPLLLLAVGPMLAPLQRRNAAQRELMGDLANVASDIVSGLRVLRGVGGERVFHDRYRRQSQQVRAAGVRVARLQSVLDALQVLLPGLFVVVVVWLGARFAVEGRITPGELVAFYGYAAFLVLPLRTATEFATKLIKAHVAAGRIVGVLRLEPEIDDPEQPTAPPPADSPLHDALTGLTLRPGRLTALVTEPAADAAEIADRLGRYRPGDVRWGGVALADLPRAEIRRRIVVSDTASTLFAGRLGDQVDIRGRGPTPLAAATEAASAYDVVEALPGEWDAEIAERGRTFSGGQRQRLVLTRVLLVDPEVLVLVEPTSAVDAHTEAAIAARLGALRAGRTTLVTTTSPLVLDRADTVCFVRDGQLLAEGTHAHLLAEVPAYRAVVTREAEEGASR